jgi:hypothetical protein
MKEWEKEIFALIDQLISKIISNEGNKMKENEELLIKAIYEALYNKYKNKNTKELRLIFGRLIKMRLPHPAVILCFPGFKERIEQSLSFTLNQAQDKPLEQACMEIKPTLEAAIRALYPYSNVKKNVHIGQLTVQYFLPKEKIAFIIKESVPLKYELSSFFFTKKKIKIISVQSDNYINHCELKRKINLNI